MEDILMKSVIEKLEAQENKIAEIEVAIKNLPSNTLGVEEIKNVLESIKEIVEGISFPIQEMRELSRSVTECRKQLSLPVQNSVQHHHHFPKIAWLTAVFFVALLIVCPGWYMTGTASKAYKANDTKYRYLKLNPNRALMQLLFYTDSLYRMDPNMRDSVIQKEEDINRLFVLEREAESMKKETEKLKRKVKGK
jgi:hypothetical protein